MAAITPRQEEVLSYLVGLAPVGEAMAYLMKDIVADLRIKDRRYVHHDVRRLADVGAVEIIDKGKPWHPSTIRVMRRPEEFMIVRPAFGRAA